MSVYLDANVLVALFVQDPSSARVAAAMAQLDDVIAVSDLAALEFASVVARNMRGKLLSPRDAGEALDDFDLWVTGAQRVETNAADVAAADAMVRRLDVNLHGADAIHVALALRVGAVLFTLDAKMKNNAKKLSVPVV